MKAELKILVFILLLFFIKGLFAQNNWIVQQSNTSDTLWGVNFVDFNNGWVVGEHGLILHTTNGGTNWSVQQSASSATLYSIFFSTPTNGIICGNLGVIEHTTDGGNSWSNLSSGTSQKLRRVYFVNASIGWIVGGDSTGKVLKTTDGGNTWISQSNCATAGLKGVFFINPNTGWSVSWWISGTTDGGTSWQCASMPELESVYFANSLIGYVVGYEEYVSKTSDGGVTWIPKNPSVGTNFMDVYAAPDLNTIYICGRYGYAVKSIDGGNSWSRLLEGTPDNDLLSLSFINANTGTVVGQGGLILRTTNGGTPIYDSISGQIKYQDNNQPVTMGCVKALKYDRVLDQVITVDSTIIQSNGNYSLIHIHPQDSLYIMAFENDESQLLYVPTYYPSSTNWQNATILYPTGNLTNIDVLVYRINNTGGPYHIGGHVFTYSSDPLSGLNNAIVYAKAGSDYKSYSISNNAGLYRVDSLQSSTYILTVDRIGYAPVNRSVLISTYSKDTVDITFNMVGIVQKGKDIPKFYILGNNYPNPFNPTTKISFGLPRASNTKLIIYDILGKEVATLINEELKAGNYNIEWNAGNYSSGIYFYRLESGDFVQTKKMLLIK